MKLTVFTPAYNRAYILNSLYESLKQQSSKDFEWLIVDDGSTDDTENLITRLQLNNRLGPDAFPIRYFKQENGGKHRAINRGLLEAEGDLFFIVDSDDQLTPDAVEWIINQWKIVETEKCTQLIAGVSGIRITPEGQKIGGDTNFGTIVANALEIREKYHVKGDLAEVYRTDVLRQLPFPEFEGEKFCPEALVWFRIAQHYKMRYVYHGIYVCNYLPDGLTAKIVKVRHHSPLTSMTYYSELYGYEKSVRLKLRAAINFWRFFKGQHNDKVHEMGMMTLLSLCALPIGIMAKLNDYRNHNL